jgi:hypothetical protein
MSVRGGLTDCTGARRPWAEIYLRVPFTPRTVQVSWAHSDGWFCCVINEHFRPVR